MELRESRNDLRKVDPGQLRVAIRALDVLCRLQSAGLPFVFKGGTSMLLHLPAIRRISVDVDIVCAVAPREFEAVLNEVVSNGNYVAWEPDERGDRGLPKRRHYALYFPSHRGREGRQCVTVDVVEEPCPLRDLVEMPVQTNFLEIESETKVTLPSLNALLGDKLTAFAPHTVGVPLNKRYAQQVAKQMFDVGELFLAANDFKAVKSAYLESQASESSYQPTRPSLEDSLRDTLETAYEFCHHGLRKDPNRRPEDRENLLRGIGQMAGILVGTRYRAEEARIHASRAARMADAILRGEPTTMQTLRYDPSRDMESLVGCALPLHHKVLQRLSVQPEALFHWKNILAIPS